MPFPPCLLRAVTDDLAKSRSEHADVRLTTQCVHSDVQMPPIRGSRGGCVRLAPDFARRTGVVGHAALEAHGKALKKQCKTVQKALKSIEK